VSPSSNLATDDASVSAVEPVSASRPTGSSALAKPYQYVDLTYIPTYLIKSIS
jgi:hypothetical protein